ncbi:MAG: SgcJ/EcaC family oxidoreductase [Burkholderiales bacterium]|nr:SgcJ/EcaC family oxidoreductase [Burkholderiales bacterium]
MIRSIGLSVLLTGYALAAHAAPATPELTAQAFVDAWNSHDAQNFDGLFTDDAWWVPVVESRLSGREQIVADLKQAHAIWAGRTTLASSDVVVSPLSETAAAVLFKAGFLGKDGKRMEPPNVLLLAVVKTTDGWRIKAGQLSKPGATVMPAK